jgi:hypothetical protein
MSPPCSNAPDSRERKFANSRSATLERIARFISMLAPVLMTIGMLALWIEFQTPGIGWGAVVGADVPRVVFLRAPYRRARRTGGDAAVPARLDSAAGGNISPSPASASSASPAFS